MASPFTAIFLLWITLGIAGRAYSQNTGDLSVGAGLDAYKTDNLAFADKFQFGMEVDYFLSRKMAVLGGFELWSTNNNSLVLGFRYFPVKSGFARFRGLVGQNDITLGVGYCSPPKNNLRFEGSVDYFLDQRELALRFSIVFYKKRY